MFKRNATLYLILVGLLVGACARNGDNETLPQNTPTAVIEATNTLPPAPTRSPTAAPSPTATIPHIAVADQIITDDGEVTIASVISNESGWLVIYTWQEGELGEVLGYTAVTAGSTNDAIVEINPQRASPTLAAILHVDRGQSDQFEFPDGPDVPLEYESAQIATTFVPEFDLSSPIITISDQEVAEDGLVLIDSVLALSDGWLVIHADEDGQLGDYLGSVPVQPGLNESLQVHIPWRRGSIRLHAVIYEDNGRERRLDFPDEDVPLLINESPVVKSFTVTYPPDLFVLDQPIVGGKFQVERAYSNGPGWLVVYFDNEGEPGLIIGYAPLADGVNEKFEVEVLETAVTNPLHLRLHEDSEPGDDFDFPRVDPPVVYDGRQLRPFTFNSEPGNYLLVRDQAPHPITEETLRISIATAVVNGPAWLVIYGDENGSRGDILGFTQLDIGLSQDVEIDIQTEAITELLYAALHLDAGEIGEFEYPEGDDVPLQRNRSFLEVPFRLLMNEAEEQAE